MKIRERHHGVRTNGAVFGFAKASARLVPGSSSGFFEDGPRTEKSCGPDAPTLASSCARRVPARPGSTGNKPARRRWQESPVAEESAKDTVKTTAQGRPDDPPVPVVLPRAIFSARGPWVRAGTRPSLRPLALRGQRISLKTSGAWRCENAKACRTSIHVSHRHREERLRRSNPESFPRPWIALRSLSSGARSRDPVARNDGDGHAHLTTDRDSVCFARQTVIILKQG
jgi:hypothetical protein